MDSPRSSPNAFLWVTRRNLAEELARRSAQEDALREALVRAQDHFLKATADYRRVRETMSDSGGCSYPATEEFVRAAECREAALARFRGALELYHAVVIRRYRNQPSDFLEPNGF